VLTRAVVVGDRLYLRLRIADREGERTVSDLSQREPPEAMTSGVEI
jgi:hypothetical protein